MMAEKRAGCCRKCAQPALRSAVIPSQAGSDAPEPWHTEQLPREQPSQHSQLRARSHPYALHPFASWQGTAGIWLLPASDLCLLGEAERRQLSHPLKYKISEIICLYKKFEFSLEPFLLHHSTLFNSMLSNWDVIKYVQQILWYSPEFASVTSGKGQDKQCIFGRQAISGKWFWQKNCFTAQTITLFSIALTELRRKIISHV